MLAAVMSSWVGPMPPVEKTWSYLARSVFTASTMSASASGTTRTSRIWIPASFSWVARKARLTSWVRPERISLPMIPSAAVTVCSAIGSPPCCRHRYNPAPDHAHSQERPAMLSTYGRELWARWRARLQDDGQRSGRGDGSAGRGGPRARHGRLGQRVAGRGGYFSPPRGDQGVGGAPGRAAPPP